MKELQVNKHIFWNILGSMMFALNTVLMLILISRLFGVAVAGEFGIANTIAQLLFIMGNFGMNTYQMTDYQKKYSFQEYLSAKIPALFLMAVVCTLIIIFSSFSVSKSTMLMLMTLFMLTNAFAEVFQSHLFQINRLDLSGKSLFYRSIIPFLVFAVCVIWLRNLYISLVFMNIINIVTTAFFFLILIKPFNNIAFSRTFNNILAILSECFPIFASAFIKTFMVGCTRYVIDFFMDNTDQGYFNVLFIMATILNLFSSFIFRPLFKTFSDNLSEGNVTKYHKLLKKQILIIICATVFLCIVCYGIGPLIIGFIFGLDLKEFSWEMILITIGGGFLAISELFYFLLVILREQRRILLIYIFCSLVSILLSILFIKSWGILGATNAFLLSYLLLAILFGTSLVTCLQKRCHNRPFKQQA